MLKYQGIIVEEALSDSRIINQFFIKKVKITCQENAKERWHMYQVETNMRQIKLLQKYVVDNWYIHFWYKTNVVAIFKDKIFEFDYKKKESWNEVITYGLSIGIPKNELDFPIKGL